MMIEIKERVVQALMYLNIFKPRAFGNQIYYVIQAMIETITGIPALYKKFKKKMKMMKILKDTLQNMKDQEITTIIF